MGFLSWPENESEATAYAKSIFREVAPRYDRMKAILSLGREKRWKCNAIRAHLVEPTGLWLDLATGTGDIMRCAEDLDFDITVVGFDLKREMLELAKARWNQPAPDMLVGDLNELPFGNNCADVISIGYGLRYLTNVHNFSKEILRILKPGGQFIAFDLGHPPAAFRGLWYGYLLGMGTVLGMLLHRNARTYWHLVETLRAYDGQRSVAEGLRQVGFERVTLTNLVAGTMALHHARKPA